MQRMTREKFHRWTDVQKGRCERIAGEPIAMSPEHMKHVRLKTRIWAALDQAIHASALDAAVLGNGITIDTTDKLDDCFCSPSIPHDLIVRARRQEMIHHSRYADAIPCRTVNIRTIVPGVSLGIADVYRT